MNTELMYLVWITAFTAIMWVPYILDRIAVWGLADTVGYPDNPKTQSPWARRMKAAHANAIENLAIFAALVSAGFRVGVWFFIWLSIVNYVLVGQFWAFANDLYSKKKGERLFGLIGIGAVATFLLLDAISRRQTEIKGNEADRRLAIALMLAIGIGLHNLGEGLAIGAAYSVGAITLGTFLVVGFIIQNITEGLGIIAPVLRDKPSLDRLVLMGWIGGAPAILGAWIGGYTPSPFLAVLFLAVGAGADRVIARNGHAVVAKVATLTLACANAVGASACAKRCAPSGGTTEVSLGGSDRRPIQQEAHSLAG